MKNYPYKDTPRIKNKIFHRISRFYLNEYLLFKLCTQCTLFYFIYSTLLYANMIMAIPKQCMTNVSINLILSHLYLLKNECWLLFN